MANVSRNQGVDAPPPYSERRARIRLSCLFCREKKMKCNRAQPCDNCTKRGKADSCHYIAYPDGASLRTRRRPVRTSEALQNRIRDLEQLVNSLKGDKSHDNSDIQTIRPNQRSPNHSRESNPATAISFETEEPQDTGPNQPGKVVVGPDGKRYVDATHWQAILDSIARVTDDLKGYEYDHVLDEVEMTNPATTGQEPIMILRAFSPITREELQSCLPPREVVNRLVSRFFSSNEPSYTILHVPTFLKEYDEFWTQPQSKSTSWLGLLFIMLAHACFYSHSAGEALPGNLNNAPQAVDFFRMRAVQCLVLDDYTKPGRYKIEALMLYFGAEYMLNPDAHLGASILLAIIIRAAMQMGYHRDPKYFKEISPFEGEMRRRLWSFVTSIDRLISYQVGIPKTISKGDSDTEPPRNLLDEDFNESTSELPESRPESQLTPILYAIVKNRVMAVYGSIAAQSSSWSPILYEDVMRLDHQLETARASYPESLCVRPMSQSITDPPHLIVRRYNLEFCYQKSRCILHRGYLTKARDNPRFSYSRWACIDAARALLKHQVDINNEAKPGGLLYRENHLITSIKSHDFLLGAAILCVEISHSLVSAPKHSHHNDGKPIASKDEIITSLQQSCKIWETLREVSAEANKSFVILSSMLNKVVGNSGRGKQQKDANFTNIESSGLSFTGSPTHAAIPSVTPPSTFNMSNDYTSIHPGSALLFNNGGSPLLTNTFEGLQGNSMDSILDLPLDFDWSVFDLQTQNTYV